MRVQVMCTLTPDAKKGNPKAARTTSPPSMSLQQPRVLNQRGAQQRVTVTHLPDSYRCRVNPSAFQHMGGYDFDVEGDSDSRPPDTGPRKSRSRDRLVDAPCDNPFGATPDLEERHEPVTSAFLSGTGGKPEVLRTEDRSMSGGLDSWILDG